MNYPTCLFTDFSYRSQKEFSAVICEENFLPIVPSAHYVVMSTGIFDSFCTGHKGALSRFIPISNQNYKKSWADPFSQEIVG
jgi:hypothetical protein